jgi:hypothetical protein
MRKKFSGGGIFHAGPSAIGLLLCLKATDVLIEEIEFGAHDMASMLH